MRSSHLVLSLLVLVLIATLGCGERTNTVWITGKLLKGGAKYVPPDGQTVSVTLVGLEVQDASGKPVQSGEQFWAEVDHTNGTFTVSGNLGQGIPPGRYRVAVTQKMTREAFHAAHPRPKRGDDREADMLKNRYGLTTSPIIREVRSGSELVIDLDRPSE